MTYTYQSRQFPDIRRIIPEAFRQLLVVVSCLRPYGTFKGGGCVDKRPSAPNSTLRKTWETITKEGLFQDFTHRFAYNKLDLDILWSEGQIFTSVDNPGERRPIVVFAMRR